MDTFRIEISKYAERLDFESLPEGQQIALCEGIAYDDSLHDLYRFSVTPIDEMRKMKRRLWDKKSYNKVNRVLVQAKVPSSEIQLLGIYPTTCFQAGEPDDRLGVYLPLVGKSHIAGRAKEAVKRGEHKVIAGRTDEIAQWVFCKPYVKETRHFPMQLLCVVAKSLPSAERYIQLEVAFKEGKREIESAHSRKVMFPTG